MKEVIPDVGGRFSLDENVVNGLCISLLGPTYSDTPQVLPKDSKVIECISFPTAAWTRASRVVVEFPDGTQKSYFLKVRTTSVAQGPRHTNQDLVLSAQRKKWEGERSKANIGQ